MGEPTTAISAAELRKLFLLDPEIAFLNHGSFGAVPGPVFERYQEIQREFESNPVLYHGRRFNELMRGAREELGRYVNADPLDLVFVTNATVGVNIVTRSLKLDETCVVLTTDHEYGACDRMWEQLRRESRFTIERVVLPVPVISHEDVVQRIVAGFRPETSVLFISHITSPTALTLPIAEICREARSRGIITVVDGAHAIGQIPLDLQEIDPDYYTSNLHKWLCAPKGSAFLYARRDMQERLEPLVTSWGYEPVSEYDSRFIGHHEYRGTREVAAALTTKAAVEFQEEYNWPERRKEAHALVLKAREQLADRFGFEPIVPLDTPDPSAWLAQMSSHLLPETLDGFAFKERLYDEHRVEIPVFDWNGRQTLRLSVQAYNTDGEIDRLMAAIEVVMPEALS